MRNQIITLAAALALSGCVTGAPSGYGDLSKIAAGYSGLHERTDRKKLSRLVGVDPTRVPWCGAFAAAVAGKAGYEPPRHHLAAISWTRFGRPVKLSKARPGDVVVMRNHVTFFTRSSRGRVCGIGGNQGNAVRESCYSAGRVKAVRRPVS
jgi:uncharacterized protein (TIGR02594 family)